MNSRDEAIPLLEDYLLSNPRDASSWFLLGGLYDANDEESKALRCYQEVARLGVDLLPAGDRPKLYLQLGSTLRNLHRFDDARECLAKGRDAFPEHLALLAFQGLVAYSQEDFRDGLGELLKGLMDIDDLSFKEYKRALCHYIEKLD